jgi:DNA-binding transcriptional MerR regulator/methylmalonyl-CoA mutase cobalamin-binding subunit
MYNVCIIMTNNNEARLPIRTVSALTGVNAVTLRAWERRYGLIRPHRTAKGHRLYTTAQVEEIQRVLALMRDGVAIGQVSDALRTAAAAPEKPRNGAWASYRKRMAAAIAAFDEQALEALYEETLSLHPVDRVNRMLLMPLLEELGGRWSTVAGGVAEEHFFSAYMRNKLGARFHHRRALPEGPKLLLACVPGEQHEIGLFMFALAAHDAAMRVVFLGANVPVAESGAAARRARCDAVVLSSSIEPPPEFFKELTGLVAAVRRPVYVGGGIAASHTKRIEAAGAIPVGSGIEAAVRRIAAELHSIKEPR